MVLRDIHCIAALIAIALVASQATGAIVILQPGPADGKDTYIDNRVTGTSVDPTPRVQKNYGGSPRYQVGHSDLSNSNVLGGLLEFDFSAIPNASVQQAILTLTTHPTGAAAGTLADVYVHQTTGAWEEMVVTWLDRPSYDPTPVASTPVTAATLGLSYEWDVTSLVNSWFSGTPNFGMYMLSGANNGEAFRFVSSDDLDYVDMRPMLTLTTVDAVVPEPASLVLWAGLGIIGVIALRRRKRNG